MTEQPAPAAPSPQPTTATPVAAQPQGDGKIILRFKGINIPGGKALPKGYKMSKDKSVEHIISFINKSLKDTQTTYVCFFISFLSYKIN